MNGHTPVEEMLRMLEARADGFDAKARAARDLIAALKRCQELEARPDGPVPTPLMPTDGRRFIPSGTNSTGRHKKAGQIRGRRQPIAPGSLPDRIVAALTEAKGPVKFGDLVACVKAHAWDVRTAVDNLLFEKRIVKQGQSRATVYVTPSAAKHHE